MHRTLGWHSHCPTEHFRGKSRSGQPSPFPLHPATLCPSLPISPVQEIRPFSHCASTIYCIPGSGTPQPSPLPAPSRSLSPHTDLEPQPAEQGGQASPVGAQLQLLQRGAPGPLLRLGGTGGVTGGSTGSSPPPHTHTHTQIPGALRTAPHPPPSGTLPGAGPAAPPNIQTEPQLRPALTTGVLARCMAWQCSRARLQLRWLSASVPLPVSAPGPPGQGLSRSWFPVGAGSRSGGPGCRLVPGLGLSPGSRCGPAAGRAPPV